MKLIKISSIAALACAVAVSANASDTKPKRQLKNNMMVVYNQLPQSVNTLSEAFSEGMLYGRLRSNYFKWDWKNDNTASTGNKDNQAMGVGGSLIYKTAPIQGLSATMGLYYTASPFEGINMDRGDIKYLKAGKDTTSRHEINTGGHRSFGSLSEAFLQYDISNTSIRLGSQIFESFLTKSNDTKMIPNTFEGITIVNTDLPKTTIRGAYFTAQKLRDHTHSHSVIAFKDASGTSWNNNDDAAVHKGLTFANGLQSDNELIVVDARNKSIKNLQVDLTYGAVPDVVSSITAELNYQINLGDTMTLTPGVRYMHQMDDGGGAIGGASLKGTVAKTTGAQKGYKNAASLDSSLFAARLTLKDGPLKAQVGYSAIEDEGDIVAPWRGFPTGGYTRAMAQYNWYANTKTTCVEVNYDFGKAKILPGFSALARYAMQDFDDAKQAAGVQADSNILHMDLRQNITDDFYAKIRIGLIDADSRLSNGVDKDSYNEYRFELNYLF